MNRWVIPAIAGVAAVGATIGIVELRNQPKESQSGETKTVSAVVEPGGDAAAAQLAQSNPDEFAWQLFEFINLEGASGVAGMPATGVTIRKYSDDRPVIWETWALASGERATQAGSEVYKPDGSDPGDWSALPRATAQAKVLSIDLKATARALEKQGIQEDFRTLPNGMPASVHLLIDPKNPADQEVRMNKAAFDFVRANELYNVEGLEAKFKQAVAAKNRDLIQFPAAAKEVKALWLPTRNPTAISADEKSRFHWRKVGNRYYKLAALHIITKDIKQWFWADFAQEDYELKDRADHPTQALPSIDSTTRGPGAPARGTQDGERKELTGSKWAHYRLRGAQIDFDKPRVLGNTLIEPGFADQSSCMTCHFNATIATIQSNGCLDTLSPGDAVPGKPDDSALGSGNVVRYLQNDFVWSAPFRAQSKTGKKCQ